MTLGLPGHLTDFGQMHSHQSAFKASTLPKTQDEHSSQLYLKGKAHVARGKCNNSLLANSKGEVEQWL